MNSIDKPNTPHAAENYPLYILRDNLAKADAFITAAEDLIEQTGQTEGGGKGETEHTEGGGEGDDDDVDDNRGRRRNHIEHLVESAKRAVRAALAAATEL